MTDAAMTLMLCNNCAHSWWPGQGVPGYLHVCGNEVQCQCEGNHYYLIPDKPTQKDLSPAPAE